MFTYHCHRLVNTKQNLQLQIRQQNNITQHKTKSYKKLKQYYNIPQKIYYLIQIFKSMQKKYKGLSNIGATCYMNSLLQTLFMTPQFRNAIYKWSYNQKIHPKQQDSIIYQLQKLFGKLQTDFPGEVTTKDLVKSFQWQIQQAQMQQDIQQFNRLLFQALQKSLNTKSEKYIHQNFVKDYFEGELVHYTKCLECQTQSAREEYFQDLIVTVKNIYEKVYNDRLELGLQRYLKPQILDQDNLYDCQKCGKKTRAQRGARFIKMPTLLNVILQRFNFNYFTMERQKVNDRVEFPFVLNFNDYINGYVAIPNKLNEDSSEYFKGSVNGINGKVTANKPTLSSRTTVQKKSTVPSVAGKTKTKPSASTKGFLAEMRKRKKMEGGENEDLFFVNGTATARQVNHHESNGTVNGSLNGQINGHTHKIQQERSQIIKQNGATKQNDSNKMQLQPSSAIQPQAITKPIQPPTLPISLPPPPPPLSLTPTPLSQPFLPSFTNQTPQQQLQRKHQQSQKLQQQKQSQLIELQQKINQKIEEYLKQGSLVYELYAVMVHNGTANHGHYFSYIKSFEDGKWYCFNDDRVTLINVLQIEKTFGNGNSNAYALYYRLISQQAFQQLSKVKPSLPSYISQQLQLQKSQIRQKQQLKTQNLQNLIVLKICYQLYVKQLEVYKSNSVQLVLKKARELFSIPGQVKLQNSRLRMFNPATEMKLETYGGREHRSLEQLKIGSYKSLLLQIKSDSQQFQEYEADLMPIRLALLQLNPQLSSLAQSNLTLHKLSIPKHFTILQLLQVISQKRNQLLNQSLPFTSTCLIKRHQNNDQTIHEVISIEQNYQKTVEEMMILQNEIVFVERNQEKLVWPEQFENQVYRITVRFNRPGTAQYENYLTDSRLTLKQLKSQLSAILDVSPQDLVMKWGTRSGRQLKDLNLTLKQSRFITGTQVYFDFGIPAQPGQIRIQLFLATDASSDVFNRLHDFEYIADVPISGQLKASEVKQVFIKVVKKVKGLELNENEFRIRERVSDKIGKIYRQKPMKEQQLIQKRQIAIELVPDTNLDSKQFSVYFRFWDQQNWTLSPKLQLTVSKSTTVKQLCHTLSKDHLNTIVTSPSQLQICRILSIHKFTIVDLTEMEWFSMDQEVSVIGEPMFVNADGLLYVVKNGGEEPRELTKEEEKKFGGVVRPAVVRNNVKASTQKKEAPMMKIMVVEKEMEESEQGVKKEMIDEKQQLQRQRP